MTYAEMDSVVYMGGSPETEHQFMTTGAGPSVETSWSDNTVFEPYVATYQSEPTPPQRVRPFLQEMML